VRDRSFHKESVFYIFSLNLVKTTKKSGRYIYVRSKPLKRWAQYNFELLEESIASKRAASGILGRYPI
jgi:hypothetical protein